MKKLTLISALLLSFNGWAVSSYECYDLKDKGIITDEEFQQKKEELLERI